MMRSIEKKNRIIKNYIRLNYDIPETDLTKEDTDLIKLTFYNTLKNRKIGKINKTSEICKKLRNREKKVTFICC